MRVFVTGATGFVGTAVVRELLDAGHEVLGLTRSDSGADALAAAGAKVHRGTLEDLDSLRTGAAETDGVIHTAFIHDFSNFQNAAEVDLRAVETLGEALAGSDRPLVITSGTGILPPGRVATENDNPDANSPTGARGKSEDAVLSLADREIRTSVVRLPPSVHGEGDKGFVPALIGIARQVGVSSFIGDGDNRWATVHRLDAARLFRLAVESAPAGTRLHAVGDDGVPVREIAEAIGRGLDLPVNSVDAATAGDRFGWLSQLLAQDLPASSALTRQRLPWRPERPGLIADLDAGTYFTDQ